MKNQNKSTSNQNKSTEDWSKEIVLTGRRLRLEPLAFRHLDDLERNLLSPNSWHCVHWGTRSRVDIENVITGSEKVRQESSGNSFAMIEKTTGQAVGMSRLMNFNQKHNYLEIGGTWIGDKYQKTFVNTEAKLLMLSYVFETLQCQRVEFRVDALNLNSQRAVLRVGAKFEGELRNSVCLPDGRKRDYRVYSIIDSEWPNIKGTLHWYLDRYV